MMAKSMTKKFREQTINEKRSENVGKREEENNFSVDVSLEGSIDPCMGQPPPPDGGWGWFVVFGAFMIHLIIDGVLYSFGVFYFEFLDYFQDGKGATAWIVSILIGISFCSGPITSILVNKYGCRAVTIFGSILASLCLLASVWAPSIVVLYFTIGLGTGLGFGFAYMPAMVAVTCYFEKYRSLATGISVCGSGLGTLLFSPFLEYLIGTFGWRTAMMFTSVIVLNCIISGAIFRPLKPVKQAFSVSTKIANGEPSRELTIENLFARPDRVSSVNDTKEHRTEVTDNHDPDSVESSFGPNQRDTFYQINTNLFRRRSESFTCSEGNTKRPSVSLKSLPNGTGCKENENFECLSYAREKTKTLCQMLELSLFKDPVFLLFALSNFCTSLGFDVPYVYLVARAEERGIDKSVSDYLLSVMGVSNIVGRVALGYLSDKPWINRSLIYNLCLTISGLSTALSPFCDSFASFAVYAVIFGFTVSAFMGQTSIILVDLLGLERFTNAFGLLLFIQGCGCFIGPPVTGWLYDSLNSYDLGFFVAGCTMAISGLMLFLMPLIQRTGIPHVSLR